jgi:succinate dehydrogenase/fumarate reductase flavoprotein subunit
LRSNHSFVKDVKQDRKRKSFSNASVEAALKEKNRLKKIARRRGSTPQDRRAFYGEISSHCCLKRIHEQAQRYKDATFQERSFLRNFYNFAKEAVAGAEVIHPSSQLRLQIGTTLKSTRFRLGSSRAI